MISIRYESKGGDGRLARMTVRADVSQLKVGDQKLIMHRLGQLMIDEIRSLWTHATLLDGTKATWEPPTHLRAAEAAVLTKRIARRTRKELARQGLILDGKLKTKKAKQALREKKPLKEKTAEDVKKAADAKEKREWTAKVIKNYKIRSPKFTRTAIHGTEKPRMRDYVPDPRRPALWGSGLMKDSLYCVFLPQRSYTDKKTGEQILVNSGFQFVVQKNRHLAAYRAGMRDRGIQYVMWRVGSVDLSMLVDHYVAWDGSEAWAAFSAAAKTAGHLAGLVESTLGFLV